MRRILAVPVTALLFSLVGCEQSMQPEQSLPSFQISSSTGYNIVDLGTLGGDSYAYDINDLGQIVGYSEIGTGANHAFLWEKGEMIDLGTFGGDYSIAYGITEKRVREIVAEGIKNGWPFPRKPC